MRNKTVVVELKKAEKIIKGIEKAFLDVPECDPTEHEGIIIKREANIHHIKALVGWFEESIELYEKLAEYDAQW